MIVPLSVASSGVAWGLQNIGQESGRQHPSCAGLEACLYRVPSLVWLVALKSVGRASSLEVAVLDYAALLAIILLDASPVKRPTFSTHHGGQFVLARIEMAPLLYGGSESAVEKGPWDKWLV